MTRGWDRLKRIARPGVIDVVALLVGQQPVIRRVVDSLEGQGRPTLVAFGGVVVDHIQNDLEAGIVKARHHLLELAQGLLRLRGVARVRREEADAVVTPVIRQPLLEQMAVIDEGVDRQQLDGRDAEAHATHRRPRPASRFANGNMAA